MFGWFEKPSSIRRVGPEFGAGCAKIHAQSFAHPWAASEFESLLAGRDVVGQAAISTTFGERGGLLASYCRVAPPTPPKC
jgi:hypothetical protein